MWPGVLGHIDVRFESVRRETDIQTRRWSCPAHDLDAWAMTWVRHWRFYSRGMSRPYADWHEFEAAVYIALDGEQAALDAASLWRPEREGR